MRTLVLLRHAKSAYPPGVADHERPLADRGRRDAPAAGKWLALHCAPPDVVLVSTARRAQETWDLVKSQLPACGEVRDEGRIYEAATPVLRDIVATLPGAAGTVLVVGHNPGLEDLAVSLATDGVPDALGSMAMKYPTCGIAVLTGDGAWADMLRHARLAAFAVPRG